IYGTPYDGTIGSGKAYPPGYQGPDTMLYMYVDVNVVNNQTVPRPPAVYYTTMADLTSGDDSKFIKGEGLVGGVDNSFLSRYHATFSDFTFINPSQQSNSVNYTDFTDPQGVRTTLTNLSLPIQASGYTFVAPG